ncbi:MAG: hypothetical protein H7Y07_06730, partial [Pyrinomonadaceae bacterium]|nr:hypothetical protein [Sphingobacteriaceae bacterium]
QNKRNPAAKKATFIATPILATLISVGLFLNPDLINNNQRDNKLNAGFTIGQYPTLEKLVQLKKEGYTTIISLLHPSVIPFEPKLMAEEEVNAKKAGIELVSIPLLPWINDNEESIEKLRKLIRTTPGRIYIHCYLGRDRVNVAKAVILQESKLQVAGRADYRSLDSISAFERGKVYKLDDKTFFIPMPTEEEYFGYVIAADFKQVVSLKDLSNPESQASIGVESRWLAPYKIPLKVFNTNNFTEAKMKLIVDSVKSMNVPKVIHAFKSDEPEAQLFIKLFKKTP